MRDSPFTVRRRKTGNTKRLTAVLLPCLFAPLIDRKFLVQPGDHFANTGLGKSLRSHGMLLLQFLQPALERANLLLGFLIFGCAADHNSISTSPLRLPSASRVRLKNST